MNAIKRVWNQFLFHIYFPLLQSNFQKVLRFAFILCSLALLLYTSQNSQPFKSHLLNTHDNVSSELELFVARFYHNRQLRLSESIQESDRLITLYTFGLDWGLGEKYEKIHIDMGLKHLMTPSGLQITPIVLFLALIFPKRILGLVFIIFYLLALMHWKNSEFAALQRMLLFHGIQLLGFKNIKISSMLAFAITFLIDFMVGTFSLSPYSFWLSFTFLGLIHLYRPKYLLLGFLITQLIVSIIFQQNFSFIHSLIGMFFSITSVGLFFLSLIYFSLGNFIESVLSIENIFIGYFALMTFVYNQLPIELLFKPNLSHGLLAMFCIYFKSNIFRILTISLFSNCLQ